MSDTTNVNGEYSLSISSGRWEIGYDLPMAEDGRELPYIPSPPKRVKLKKEEIYQLLILQSVRQVRKFGYCLWFEHKTSFRLGCMDLCS